MDIKISELAELLGAKNNLAEVRCEVSGQHIVVLDRGFVYVGDVARDGDCVRIKGAKNLRKWGTASGLGELRNGPSPTTVADFVGDVIAPMKAVIHFIKCSGF